ncbi:hypothetical protein [Parvularcula marina]|uniref:hypothetical protein n=1 Tax=Parvularcula marina TaxID=2292771 RepID=UPI001314D589|nr:hypothetical protein [Parvularcula marina]
MTRPQAIKSPGHAVPPHARARLREANPDTDAVILRIVRQCARSKSQSAPCTANWF